MLFIVIANDARLRIGKLATARQCQLQEYAVALESNDTAADDVAAFLYGSPGCTIQPIP